VAAGDDLVEDVERRRAVVGMQQLGVATGLRERHLDQLVIGDTVLDEQDAGRATPRA
jgi:hypothetical protein